MKAYTKPLALNPFSCADMDVVLDILTNTDIKQTYMLPDFLTREDALPLFRRLLELSQKEDRYIRGIYRDGQLIGFLNDVEITGGCIELGYVIHPEYWGQGYMTEALRLAISDLFRLGYRQVVCGAFRENIASIRVMEKAGMEKLAKTDEIEYRGKQHQCLYYSIYT